METMIVEVFIPALSRSFDFQLPASALIRDVINEIIRILESTQSGLTFDRSHPVMCHLDDGRILNHEDTLSEAGVYDGVRLMLV